MSDNLYLPRSLYVNTLLQKLAVGLAFFMLLGSWGCGDPPGTFDTSWELTAEGNIRVSMKFVAEDGFRKVLFHPGKMEKVIVKGHRVDVIEAGERFKVYCMDEAQANMLAEVLKKAMAGTEPGKPGR